MDILNQRKLPLNNRNEIESRLRRRYLDRLNLKVKKLRKLVIDRNWEELRSECGQLAHSGEVFGFRKLTHLAHTTQTAIPSGKLFRATTPGSAKESAEALISEADRILIDNRVSRI